MIYLVLWLLRLMPDYRTALNVFDSRKQLTADLPERPKSARAKMIEENPLPPVIPLSRRVGLTVSYAQIINCRKKSEHSPDSRVLIDRSQIRRYKQ